MANPFEEINVRLDNIESLLSDLRGKPGELKSHQDNDEFLTVVEAATFLKLSVSRVYTLISKKKRELPVIKRTKRCYFLRSDLINYLKEGRESSSAEILAEAEKYHAITQKKHKN